jgi:hypothetical protein
MKLSSLALGAATILIAAPAFTPAFAAGTASTVVVNGTVAKQCGVGNQSGGGTRAIASPVNLGSLVTTDGQLASSTKTPIAFDNVWCNAPANITMDVSPLKLTSPPPAFDASSFTAALDLNLTSDGTHAVLPTYFGVSALSSTLGATDGLASNAIPAFETGTQIYSEANLSYSMPSNAHSPGIRPLAGDYSGTVTFTATPQ